MPLCLSPFAKIDEKQANGTLEVASLSFRRAIGWKVLPFVTSQKFFFLKVVCPSTRYPSLMHTREVIKGLTFGYRTGKKRSTLTSSQTSWNVRRERKRDSEHRIRKWSHGQKWSALTACPPPNQNSASYLGHLDHVGELCQTGDGDHILIGFQLVPGQVIKHSKPRNGTQHFSEAM